ncbi:hypothetical protein PR048_024650 [Dryococelus australis]|uniref:Uncharacterized protein n=1 Tax=Dryococelus australis TaxID=614101 RepID=A0ABQ9GP61_9NEOP|nr:hypothetical protein PR048_024650 [Dryococelus australis]
MKRGEDGAAREYKGERKREITEEIRQPAASSDTIPTCENRGVTPPGVPIQACWSASMGAAGLLPPTKYMTAFPSLVRHLDHVTPTSQSRTTRVPFQDFSISME